MRLASRALRLPSRWILPLFGSGLACAPPGIPKAHAWTLRGVGALSLTRWTLEGPAGSLGAAPEPAFGGGIFIEIPAAGSWLTWDTGALFMQRKFTFTSLGTDYTRLFNALELDTGLRAWIAGGFSFSAGLYGAYGIGNVRDSSGALSAEGSFNNVATRQLDFGFQASLAYDLGMGFSNSFGFWFEARYQGGLANVSATDGYNGKFQQIQALIGIRIFGRDGFSSYSY